MEFLKKVLRAATADAAVALIERIFSEIATDPSWKTAWKHGSERAAIRSIDAVEQELLAALIQRKMRRSA